MQQSSLKGILSEFVGNYIAIPKFAWLIFPLLLIGTFTCALCLNISLYYTKVMHAQPLFIGKAVSLYYLGNLIGALLSGLINIRVASLKISALSSIGLGLFLMLLTHIQNSDILLLLMLLIGIFLSMVLINNLASFVSTAAGDRLNKLRLVTLELAVFNLCFSYSVYVLFKFSVEQITNVFLYTGSLLIGLGVIYLFSMKKFVVHANKTAIQRVSCKPNNIKILVVGLFFVLIMGLIFSMIKVIYTPTIEQRFGDTSVSVFVATVNPWLIFLVQPFLVNRVKVKNNLIVMGIGCFFVGLGYYLFGHATAVITSVFFLIVMTFGEMLFSSLSKSTIISSFEDQREGFALSVWKIVFQGGAFVGPVLSGWLTEEYGPYLVWDLCGILGIICILLPILCDALLSYRQFNRVPINSIRD